MQAPQCPAPLLPQCTPPAPVVTVPQQPHDQEDREERLQNPIWGGGHEPCLHLLPRFTGKRKTVYIRRSASKQQTNAPGPVPTDFQSSNPTATKAMGSGNVPASIGGSMDDKASLGSRGRTNQVLSSPCSSHGLRTAAGPAKGK